MEKLNSSLRRLRGQEKSSQVYICPALALGIECKGATECLLFKKGIRIALKEDRRIFTPVARSSYKWETLYDKRTSVERVNSRIDVSFGFERHYIRGLSKMRLHLVNLGKNSAKAYRLVFREGGAL